VGRKLDVSGLGLSDAPGAGCSVQRLHDTALQRLETPALGGRKVVRKYESGELIEGIAEVHQRLLENDGARRPRALSVGVRPGNLERVLQELTTITVVSGPVRGHQSGAFAR